MNQRFNEINRTLQQIQMQLQVVNVKLDRIDIALRLISDKDDQILDAVHDVPTREAYAQVLRDISNIEDHWNTWTKSDWRLTAQERTDMKAAYDDLHKDAALLYIHGDPTYTPVLAMALRINLDLAMKLRLGRDEIDNIKKGYRRFLDAALAPGTAIRLGEPVEPTDSFPVRLAKRKALIQKYVGDEHKLQPINFDARAVQIRALDHGVTIPQLQA